VKLPADVGVKLIWHAPALSVHVLEPGEPPPLVLQVKLGSNLRLLSVRPEGKEVVLRASVGTA
jgi:hypothetical protein